MLSVPQKPVKLGEKFTIKAKSPGSVGIGVLHNGRVVGRVAGEEGIVEIPADTLGSGKVRLQVAGIGNGGPKSHVMAEPIELEIELKK